MTGTRLATCRGATRCGGGEADDLDQPALPTSVLTTEPDERWTPTELELWTKVQESNEAYVQPARESRPAERAALLREAAELDAGVDALTHRWNGERGVTP
jgi:hypothetical protein